ncbi:hypothetical protein ACROYT_G000565 [Oculina patagonica]
MEPTKSSEMIIPDGPGISFGNKLSKERIVTLVVLAVAVIILIVGVVLIAVAAGDKKTGEKASGSISKQEQEEKTTASVPSTIRDSTSTLASTASPGPTSRCDFSEEAKRVGLDEFFNRVKAIYYKLHPYEVHFDPDASPERIKVEYVAYDPTPTVIKNRTDTSLALFKEINETGIIINALKHRERKALAKVKHFLQHVFGQPYDVNYYAGDWMLGPNNRCLQEICNHGNAVLKGLVRHHKPHNASDVELIETKLNTHKAGILQYIDNMKMGVRKGMVRTVEECEAGSLAINRRYLNVFLNGSTALRLIVDTGLHYVGFTKDEALKYFSEFAWDDTDLAKKEVTRYQSDPGQATAYMIGQLEIKKARKYSKDNLKDDFSLRDFHYQVLAQGSSPLAYLTDHVKKYVACVKDKGKEGCDVILNPPKKTEAKKRTKADRWPMIPKPIEHHI